MRSNELATLAGVTIRALRHYHQIGILDEPPRSANGYREYTVHHLIRVLRIKRLTALGFPLQKLPGLLDRPDEQLSQLDELDRELAAEMERLSRQREVVTQLRNARAAPDLPPELSRYASLLASSAFPPVLVRHDREQVILLAHLLGEQGLPALARVYERLSEPRYLTAGVELHRRFVELTADTDDHEIEQLADDMATVYRPIVAEFADTPFEIGDGYALIDAHSSDALNDGQRRALDLLAAHLASPD